MIGPKDERGHEWAVQDGVIMGWSESNVRYEEAWWLNPDGSVRTDIKRSALLEATLAERPFDPDWLKVHDTNATLLKYEGLGLAAKE